MKNHQYISLLIALPISTALAQPQILMNGEYIHEFLIQKPTKAEHAVQRANKSYLDSEKEQVTEIYGTDNVAQNCTNGQGSLFLARQNAVLNESGSSYV